MSVEGGQPDTAAVEDAVFWCVVVEDLVVSVIKCRLLGHGQDAR